MRKLAVAAFCASSRVRFFSRGWLTMMPEGPECRSLAESLDMLVGGSRYSLTSVELHSGRYTRAGPDNLDKVQDKLASPAATLHSVQNKGKFIYFCFEQFTMWSTLGLTGHWSPRIADSHRRLSLLFHPVDQGASASSRELLHFYDMRNFGTLKFSLSQDDLEKKLQSLGHDWLGSSKATVEEFLELGKKAAKYKRPLAVFLMDQKRTSGIGNYVLSEVLYLAKIHPFANCADVTEEGWKDLYASIDGVLSESYQSQSPLSQPLYKDQFEFRIYAQRLTPTGAVVKRQEGPHKRTLHWDPLSQTRFAPAPLTHRPEEA